MFIPLKTFKQYPESENPDDIFIYVFFFNNLYEFSTDELHVKLLYKECNLLFDKNTEIIKLETLMISGYSSAHIFNNLFNAKYDGNTITKIEADKHTKFVMDKLASGYRGISI